MTDKILSLSKKLISIKSNPENTEALGKALGVSLSHLSGYKHELFKKNGVKSILAHNLAERPKKFKIILNGHLDVIPGKDYQYKPKVKGNRLYGVGAMDMKANVACLITVFREVANKVNYPLGLQLTTDEEVGGFNGTKHQIDKGVRADFVIAGETTNFKIANKAKGILWIKVSTEGKTAHGAYPWRGKNAISKMKKFLDILEKTYPAFKQEQWATTFNLSRIETSNKSFNKIPDNCVVWLDIRYIPEETNTIVNNINDLLPKGFQLDIVVKEPAMYVDENNQYLKSLQRAGEQIIKRNVPLYGAHGSSDARHFTRIKCAGVEFGPIGGGIGSDDEWVNIPSLEKYYIVLKEFLLSLSKN